MTKGICTKRCLRRANCLASAIVVVCLLATISQAQHSARIGAGPKNLWARMKNIELDPKCAHLLYENMGFTLPIPVDGPPQGYQTYYVVVRKGISIGPFVKAILSINESNAPLCENIEKSSKSLGAIISAEGSQLEPRKFRDRYFALYDLTDQVGRAYFKKAGGKEIKPLVKKYIDEFELLSEPGMRKYYLDANPRFWKWVEKLASRTLAP